MLTQNGIGDGDDYSMTPIVYATPYLVENDEDELNSVVPLCPKPFGSNHHGRKKFILANADERSESIFVASCINL